jgi:hypothetical protein
MWLQGNARGFKSFSDSGAMSSGELNREQVIRAGLNYERVKSHQERILTVLTSGFPSSAHAQPATEQSFRGKLLSDSRKAKDSPARKDVRDALRFITGAASI